MLFAHWLLYFVAGDILVADFSNHRIQQCSSASPGSACTTVAGTGMRKKTCRLRFLVRRRQNSCCSWQHFSFFFTPRRTHAHHLRCCKHRWTGQRRHPALSSHLCRAGRRRHGHCRYSQRQSAGLLARLTGSAVHDGGRARRSGSRRCAAVPSLQRDGGRRRQLRHCRLLQPPGAALLGVQPSQLHHCCALPSR